MGWQQHGQVAAQQQTPNDPERTCIAKIVDAVRGLEGEEKGGRGAAKEEEGERSGR